MVAAMSNRVGVGVASWLPVLAWAALIFWFSAQPYLRILLDPELDHVVRKVGHMGVFGVLGLLAWRALALTTGLRWPWAWAIALAVAYAATDEAHQAFVAGRSPSPVDVAIDALGAVLGIMIVLAFVRRLTGIRRG
jgi:VanZ family protein